jgi:hypothetical protein
MPVAGIATQLGSDPPVFSIAISSRCPAPSFRARRLKVRPERHGLKVAEVLADAGDIVTAGASTDMMEI